MVFGAWLGLSLALMGIGAPEGDPSLLVVDMAGNRLLIVDPVAGRVRHEVPTGQGPHEVAASSDGRLAFLSLYGGPGAPGHEIAVIDVSSGKELRRVDLGPFRMPHGLVLVEENLYFTAEANRAVGRYNPDDDAVDRIVGLGREGTHMVAASPDGQTLYTADVGSGSITAIDRRTGQITHIEVGGQPEGLAVSPDGREIWAGQRLAGKVTIIDAQSKQVVASLETGASMAARLRFTPDGARVHVPDPQGGRLVVVDARGRAVERAIEVGAGPLGALVEPNGKRAFVPLAGEGKLVIVDLATFEVTGKIETGSIADGMAWSRGAP